MTEKIKVVITDNQKTVKVPKGLRMLIRRCCLATLRLQGYQGSAEIGVTFTDNEGIAACNERLGENRTAYAFSVPDHRDGVLGAVYISLERAEELARIYATSLQREAVHMTVSGVLGILGCDADTLTTKETEEKIMYEMGFPLSTAYALSR